jgi:hypothetical protein
MDLFGNLVVPHKSCIFQAKALQNAIFMEVVQKLKFLNNSSYLTDF